MTSMRLAIVAAASVALLAGSVLFAQTPTSLPVPGRAEDMGVGIQRTMGLLAKSTPEKRNRVRIVVYGQSISEQKWWEILRDDLKTRFPDADIEMENKAIGGFASQRLVHTVQHDIYTSYPDLVIFHVYGADQQYRQIIEGIRRHTAAEVLLQKDHVGAKWPDPTATRETGGGAWWDQYMNNEVLPKTAEQYKCGIIDIRSAWVSYLQQNKMEPKQLLRDDVHLNDAGCEVMAGLIAQYMIYRPELPFDQTLVKDIPVREEMWKEGELTVTFDGNRVDLVAGMGDGAADVLIDGVAPSKHSECYMIERPAPRPWAAPVTITRVDHDSPLLAEKWTLNITKVHDDAKNFDYALVGEKTGDDGKGSTAARFRSNSGRAILDPEWFFWSDRSGKLIEGQTMTWQVRGMLSDVYVPSEQFDPKRERTLTLAQGLSNSQHTLTLKTRNHEPLALRAIRVYRPPVK